MLDTLLGEGLFIMLLGVGFVLAFLCIMIIGMIVMSKVVGYLNQLFPEQVFVVEKPSKRSASSDDEAIAVALAVIKARG